MKFENNIDGLEFICVDTANECLASFWMWTRSWRTFFVFGRRFACVCQHEQPACLQTNCMFYFWKLPHVFVMSFDVFNVFVTSANGTGNGYGTVEMNSHVANSPFAVASLLFEKDAWFIVQLPFCKKEQPDKKKLNIACCM